MRIPQLQMLSPNLRWFLGAMVLANISSEMSYIMMPVYLASLGATVGEIGLAFSIASLVPLLLLLPGGWISDSIGRVRAVALGSLGGSLGYIGFLIAPTWQWVVVAMCLEYISSALVRPSYGAYVAEESSEELRGRVFGISNGIFLTVAVIGPILGGVLAERYSFHTMYIVACALYLSATGVRVWMARAARFSSAHRNEEMSLASLRQKMGGLARMLLAGGILTWIFITDGVRDIAYNLSGQLEPLYMAQIGGMTVEQIGSLRALLGGAIMVVTFGAGWLSDRHGERLAIVAGFLLHVLGLVVFVFMPSLTGFTLSALILGAGIGLMLPAYDALVSKAVPTNLRGVAYGLFQSSLGVFSLPAPWLGGQLWERVSPRSPFLLTAAAALLATLSVWTKFKLPQKQAAPAASEGAAPSST